MYDIGVTHRRKELFDFSAISILHQKFENWLIMLFSATHLNRSTQRIKKV